MRRDLIAIILSLGLLCGAAVDRISLLSPTDPAPYHARVFAAADLSPLAFGDWSGSEAKVPDEAASELHPNVLKSRTYVNRRTRESVGFLLVQCWDVRDLVPHSPPVCYPGRGLTLIAREPREWKAGDLTVNGTEYQFESNTFQTSNLTVVENFMILPDGRTCRNMDEVHKQVGLRTRYFGAAQVQLVMDFDATPQRRQEICEQFIAAYRPLIDVIRSGVHR